MRWGAGNQAAGDRNQTVPLLPASQSVRKSCLQSLNPGRQQRQHGPHDTQQRRSTNQNRLSAVYIIIRQFAFPSVSPFLSPALCISPCAPAELTTWWMHFCACFMPFGSHGDILKFLKLQPLLCCSLGPAKFVWVALNWFPICDYKENQASLSQFLPANVFPKSLFLFTLE